MNGSMEEDLIQRVLDGTASAEDERRLARLLESEPRVRSRYEEMERLFVTLRDVPAVEPPPGLLAAIVDGVRAVRPAPRAAPARSAWRGAVQALRSRLTPNLGYAFAAGIVAGLALFGAYDSRLRDALDGGAPGALLPSNRLADARVVDVQKLQVGGWSGSVRTRAGERTACVDIDCDSGAGATLVLDFDARALAVLGFERTSGGAGDVTVSPGRVQLTPQGQGRYRIWFEVAGSGASDLAIRVDSGGATLQRMVKTVPQAP